MVELSPQKVQEVHDKYKAHMQCMHGLQRTIYYIMHCYFLALKTRSQSKLYDRPKNHSSRFTSMCMCSARDQNLFMVLKYHRSYILWIRIRRIYG